MPTMTDIAKAAGVSQPVVSVVLNARKGGSVGVSEANRRKVLATAERMGYEIDDMARGIRTGKVKVIGFFGSTGKHDFTLKLLSGISACAEKHGYMIKFINGKVNGKVEYKKIAAICKNSRLTGLIVQGLIDKNMITLKDLIKDQDVELALLTNYCDPGDSLHVSSNDIQGIALAVEHLYNLGHRKIAFLTLNFIHPSSVIRRDAFIAKAKACNLNIPDEYIVPSNYDNIADKITTLFKDRKKAPTAIVCSGDNIAVRVKDILEKLLSIPVPEKVSITGYGDLECGQVSYPDITTVYEPFEEMGCRIAEKLIAKIEGRDFGRLEEFIDTKLIIRDSTRKVK